MSPGPILSLVEIESLFQPPYVQPQTFGFVVHSCSQDRARLHHLADFEKYLGPRDFFDPATSRRMTGECVHAPEPTGLQQLPQIRGHHGFSRPTTHQIRADAHEWPVGGLLLLLSQHLPVLQKALAQFQIRHVLHRDL